MVVRYNHQKKGVSTSKQNKRNMYELITSECVNGLTNGELKKELKKVTTAIGTIGKKTKEMAISISNIMEEESYKDDFKNDTEFAKFLGTSKGNLSKISRVGKLLKENENLSVFSIGQIEETLPLNDETRNFIIEEKEIVPSMSVKEVREVINSYKSDSKEQEETEEEQENVEEPEEIEEVEKPEELNKIFSLQIISNKTDGSYETVAYLEARTQNDIKGLIKELENYLK